MLRTGFFAALLALAACSSGTPRIEQPPPPPPPPNDGGTSQGGDAGVSDAGPPDAGTAADAGYDSGTPDAGGQADAGSAGDGGAADAGTPDAGTPDAGPDAHRIGGLGAGPWPTAPLTVYDVSHGLFEAPISASTDEQQNIWAVTTNALYLLKPGEQRFHRYTRADGLHVGPGFTEPPDFTIVIGGGVGKGQGECFVGYWFHDTHDAPHQEPPVAHTVTDPVKDMGKMDQVLLNADGTLEVRRYNFHNSNDGKFYETRNVTQAIYDHVYHPGELYIGSNHGIVRVIPKKWRLPANSSERAYPLGVEKEWYIDHVHPWAHNRDGVVVFGDFFGMALDDTGALWMGGLTSAGRLTWVEGFWEWSQSYQGHNPFTPAFGDGDLPVFRPPGPGDPVNIRAVAVAPDKTVWFASGEVEGWRGPTYGLAAAVNTYHFFYYDPLNLGAAEYNILEMVALPDGRLVLGFPNTGLLVWKPGDPKGHRVTSRNGLPGERIGRMYLDRMVDPPALYVPTDGGLAVFRVVP